MAEETSRRLPMKLGRVHSKERNSSCQKTESEPNQVMAFEESKLDPKFVFTTHIPSSITRLLKLFVLALVVIAGTFAAYCIACKYQDNCIYSYLVSSSTTESENLVPAKDDRGKSTSLQPTSHSFEMNSADESPKNIGSIGASWKPTHSPTFPPTKMSTSIAQTIRKTLRPTSSPTHSPLRECESSNAYCGCNKVISEKIDIIFLVDESGSIGLANYNIMKTAIINFANNVVPAMHPLSGTRIAYIEFSTEVNEYIEFGACNQALSLSQQLSTFGYNGGGTNHAEAIQTAHDIYIENHRDDAQLAVVMLSDGNPCLSCWYGCCSDSIQEGSGAAELKAFRAEYNFSMYLVPLYPINGPSTYDTSLFDDVGFAASDLHKYGPQDISDLNEFLNGKEFTFPLGPCVSPPTMSSASRRLLQVSDDEMDHFL